jgi:predicted short-subunit dehydrogenase-like oxidoreductase (DUF2520 family)
MSVKTGQHIVIMGCGNLAWHLAKKFRSQKNEVTVYNHRSNNSISDFKKKLGCNVYQSFRNIDQHADHYFICVADSFISSVSVKLLPAKKNALVIHCSGAKPLNDLQNVKGGKAVLYPLQSFSKNDVVDWQNIPLLLEANNKTNLLLLEKLAEQLSPKKVNVSSANRGKYHLAAVLVNNFTNSLFVAANDILMTGMINADLKLLFPLIENTVTKMEKIGPAKAQTGPAKRGDKTVMKQHKALLKDHKTLKKVYSALSKLIKEQSK